MARTTDAQTRIPLSCMAQILSVICLMYSPSASLSCWPRSLSAQRSKVGVQDFSAASRFSIKASIVWQTMTLSAWPCEWTTQAYSRSGSLEPLAMNSRLSRARPLSERSRASLKTRKRVSGSFCTSSGIACRHFRAISMSLHSKAHPRSFLGESADARIAKSWHIPSQLGLICLTSIVEQRMASNLAPALRYG